LEFSIGRPKQEDQFQGVSAIVLDEVHYLSDISRGTVWEETVCSLNLDIFWWDNQMFA
jgi:superfamily II RNA helicase